MGRRALPKIDPGLDLTGWLIAEEALSVPLDAVLLFGRAAPLQIEVAERAMAGIPRWFVWETTFWYDGHKLFVTTHDFVLEIGRLSAISTTSPSLYSPFSSCAWYLLDLATILPYSSVSACSPLRFSPGRRHSGQPGRSASPRG